MDTFPNTFVVGNFNVTWKIGPFMNDSTLGCWEHKLRGWQFANNFAQLHEQGGLQLSASEHAVV